MGDVNYGAGAKVWLLLFLERLWLTHCVYENLKWAVWAQGSLWLHPCLRLLGCSKVMLVRGLGLGLAPRVLSASQRQVSTPGGTMQSGSPAAHCGPDRREAGDTQKSRESRSCLVQAELLMDVCGPGGPQQPWSGWRDYRQKPQQHVVQVEVGAL